MLTYEVSRRIGSVDILVYHRHRLYHRVDRPAYVSISTGEAFEGYMAWWQYDRRHRKGGPAIRWEDGTMDYYIRGRQC
jgi:hypothetical protein